MVSSTRGVAPGILVSVVQVGGPTLRRFSSSFLCAALRPRRSDSAKEFPPRCVGGALHFVRRACRETSVQGTRTLRLQRAFTDGWVCRGCTLGSTRGCAARGSGWDEWYIVG